MRPDDNRPQRNPGRNPFEGNDSPPLVDVRRLSMITPSMLRDLFDYNHETGVITHKRRASGMFEATRTETAEQRCRQWNTRCAGKEAGWIAANGYRYISFAGEQFLAHRAAFAFITGEWPARHIDHINGDRSDNRWHNLREATPAENNRNQKIRKDNTSGYLGVSRHKQSGKWTARISTPHGYKSLGLFDRVEDAAAAREVANRRYGYHENHGAR